MGARPRLVPGPVFKTGEGSGNRLLVGSIPMRSRHPLNGMKVHEHSFDGQLLFIPPDIGLFVERQNGRMGSVETGIWLPNTEEI